MATWNSINFDHPSVGIIGIPKFMLISWFVAILLFVILLPYQGIVVLPGKG